MNRNSTLLPPGWRTTLFIGFLLLIALPAAAQVTPIFLETAPPDTTADCLGKLPDAETLTAAIRTSAVTFDTIAVSPRDSLSAPNAACTGGIVFRIWTARDFDGDSVRQIQEITIDAPPEDDAPRINRGALPALFDTVDCAVVNLAGAPGSYARWLSERRIAVALSTEAGCAPVVAVDDDAPDALNGFDCDDALEVTFTATDLCGATDMVVFTYVTVDTVAPVISGVVNDTFRLSCDEEIPNPVVAVADCDTMPDFTITEETTRVFDGSCREFEYDLIRTYTATDDCGNMSTVVQVFEVRDFTAPDFGGLIRQNLSCTEDPYDLDLTGRPSALSDDCTPVDSLDVTFTDEIISDGICGDAFTIRRAWRVSDRCGNSRVRVQEIIVRDELTPTFLPPPAEVAVSCADYLNTAVTGEPFGLFDNCDETVNLTFTDDTIAFSCPGNFTVERTWRIFDDCQNDDFTTQTITVTDTSGPVFTVAPEDFIFTCNTQAGQGSQEARFISWVNDLGGAEYTDGCTPDEQLDVRIVEQGTDRYPEFPAINCGGSDGIVRQAFVDIIVTDLCGNVTVQTMEYRQIDELPVRLLFCPESTVIPTDPGLCQADVFFPPPVIQDQCSDGLPFQLFLRDTQTVTSAATNQAELGSVPVDPIRFDLPINAELPVNGFTFGIFTITLENVDAEGEDEFFFIYGEDGTLLGTTARGNVQCETVVTTDTLPAFLFNQYAVDGVVTLTLEPNIPADRPGTFAVNNLCEGGTVARAELVQPVFRLTDIVYEVDIDGEGFRVVNPIDTVFRTLDLGLHQITYRATDCGGNVDECLFTLTVEDREPPVVTCPADINVVVAADSCQITLTVPAPVEVTDNCEPYQLSFEETEEVFFPFSFDPNLGTFLADAITLDLSNAPPVPVDSVDLTIELTGAFGNRRAVLDVVLPDGTVADSTRRGVAGCDSTGVLFLRLAADDFAAQTSAAGVFTLNLRPRPVTVPPATAGDGITPCDEAAVSGDGSSDGVTRARVRAVYRALYPAYFTTGATQTPTTQTSPQAPLPVVTFNQGETEFFYVVTDQGGNTDTCSIAVTVRDTTAPVAICQPTTIFVDPSGLAPITVDPSAVDGGSFDNCGLDSLLLVPNTFNCDQYGETADVTLTVTDPSGNSASCSTIVSIAPLEPTPTSSTSVCGGDTLRFFANPPTVAEPGQTIYTFQWFDPAGTLISTQENFFIPGVDEAADGAYRVTIRGLTGCEATGIVNVAIGEIPSAPVISAPARVCFDEPAILTSESDYLGSVRYEWFRSQPSGDVYLGESTSSTFAADFAPNTFTATFYAIVFVNGCESAVSNEVTVGQTERPEVEVTTPVVSACEFGSATLRADPEPNVVFEWTGPNGFTATGRVVELTDLSPADAGAYTVRSVRFGGCFSAPDVQTINVEPADDPTSLLEPGTVCPGDTLVLRAADASGDRYQFLGPNGQEFTQDEAVLRVAPVTPAFIGGWRVRILRDECFSAPSVPVNVSLGTSPIAATATIPDPVCEGNDLILQGSSNIAGSTYDWTGPNGYTATGIAPTIPDVTTAAAGRYILTVTAPSGCFARDTLDVEVLPGIRIDSITVTSGRCLQGGEPVSLSAAITPELPEGYSYEWSGPEGTSSNAVFEIPNVSLASNGMYTLTVVNPAGCRSPRFSMQVEFDFAPAAPVRPFTIGGETSICEGEGVILQTNDFGPGSTYLWTLPDNSTLPTLTNSLELQDIPADFSGEYSVRVLRNGCSSVPSETRTIVVTPFPELTVTANGPACSGQEINFQATDIAGATYVWQGPNNFSSSLPDPTIISADSTVHAGTYSVVATVNGCSSDTMFVDVDVQPTPRIPVAVPVDPICISDPAATLPLTVNPNTATAGALYQWTIQNGQVAVGEPTGELTLNLTDFGLFTGGGLFDFRVTAILDGCESAPSAAINVRIDEAGGSVADAGRDTVICEGLFLLEAGPLQSGSGRWSIVAGTGDISIANPGSRTTAVQGLTEFGGPYLFAWTLSDGSCTNYAADTVMVEVTDGEAADAGENLLACFGEPLTLGATPAMMNGSAGVWTQGLAQEILGVVITDPNDPNTTVTGLLPDNVYSFKWTVTSNCGIKEDNVLVNVSDPSPEAGDDFVVCNAERTATLDAAAPTLGSTGRWRTITPGLTLDDPDSRNATVGNLAVGENLLVWEVDEGFCDDRSRDTLTIVYAEPPQPEDDIVDVDFQGTATFDPAENDELPAGAVIFFPDAPAEGGELTANADGTFTFRAPANFAGTIELTYEVLSDGCEVVTGTVELRVGKGIDCEVPNIFTPNNDGMNDFFVVPCLLNTDEFPGSQVTIYNQWGDEVFRSGTPYRNDWDGTFQGNQLPVATYFYIINFGDGRENASGDVRIER